MAYCHVAHDCHIGNNVIISNGTQVAGHCTIGDYAIIGGVVKVHQFCTVGEYCMIGADSKITKDVPHYLLADGNPLSVENINVIGLRRRGFNPETITQLKKFFMSVWKSGYNTSDGIERYLAQLGGESPLPEVQKMIDFIRSSQRGTTR
jgi:UDP-N-acetylglucosamine acyltransferase